MWCSAQLPPLRSPVLHIILDSPADHADDVVDHGIRLVLCKDVAALVRVQLAGGIDAA